MKKINLLLAASAALLLFSCNDDGGKIDIPGLKTQGYYILGEGTFGSENSTLYYYDFSTKTATDRFTTANPGVVLGNTANDMKIYGSKLYVAVDVSNKVLVLDAASGRILEDIDMGQADGKNREPRGIACAAGKVFVSTYSGQVARIDTTSYAVDYTPYGGSFKYSEGIAEVSERTLCVANAGYGSGNTVTMIDIPSFTVTGDMTVPTNPNELAVAGDGTVYLATWMDYATGAPAALHKLNLMNKTYTTVPGVEVQRIAIHGQKLYGVNTTYDATTYAPSSSLVKVDLADGSSETMIPSKAGASFYGVNVNPLSGYVYVSDGSANEVLVFDEKGTAQPAVTNAGNGVNTVAFVNKIAK
ncbi:DUF5074 domain-containing protein [uncultured Rikenella sp.]|uniref:DUF5074 domain-containing protein n=1 Tax=uncultured Rikenella sp. TaxID=368003 RepID=UPI002610062B|nr:DUF5074 domain-containing protein [uncultured Rikenella sp.]